MPRDETYRREVTEMIEAGWRITEETPDRVTLERRTIGSPGLHLVIAVLTIWWTLGIPNLLYGAYKYVADVERTVVWKSPPGESRAAESGAGEAGHRRE